MSWWRMSLVWVSLALAVVGQAQQAQAPPPVEGAPPAADQLPPEEDKPKNRQDYAFNPVQSQKEVTVGEFYFKKNDFKAAAGRFKEATRWNDGNADAWLMLGNAEEKMKDPKAAQEAWEKYLQLAPGSKNAAEVRRKIEKLKS